MVMIINGLNGVLDTRILHVIIQERFRKADKDFERELDFKDIRFPVKIRDIYKIEKRNFIGIINFGYKNKGKYLIYVQKILSKSILIYY